MKPKPPHRFTVHGIQKTTPCRTCKALMVWHVTEKGKRIPLSWATREEIREPKRNNEVVGFTMAAHFTDCPNREEHRRPRAVGT